ncbi:MAG: hypothetical protein ACKVKL_15330 [Pseudomonadales bacterium]|jgi:hypothetical protein|tara:strand:+ start:33962 stop:34333 length:372 start_codon:yes stop_codon:yes gene_type:complete
MEKKMAKASPWSKLTLVSLSPKSIFMGSISRLKMNRSAIATVYAINNTPTVYQATAGDGQSESGATGGDKVVFAISVLEKYLGNRLVVIVKAGVLYLQAIAVCKKKYIRPVLSAFKLKLEEKN